MNDAQLITKLGIFGISIAKAINDTTNKDCITVEFKQSVKTPDVNDEKSIYFGLMNHRFNVNSVAEAWPEVVRRAEAYQTLEVQLSQKKE